jgi:Ca2+-binding RTX toxin-like protein
MFETAVEDRYGLTDEFRIGATTGSFGHPSALAALPDGGFVAVWYDGNSAIHSQIYDDNGRAVGSESFSAGGAAPSVASLPSGGFVVTWVSTGVNAQIFDANGTAVGSQILVNTTSSNILEDPIVTALANGDFAVAWDSGDTIRAQVFGPDGTTIGSEIIVNDSKPGDKAEPTITALDGGGFVVGWFEWGAEVQDQYGNLSPGSRAQIFDASGNKIGDPFALNSFIIGYQEDPALASLPSGGFVAAYADNGIDNLNNSTGHGGIWVQLFDASGDKIGSDIQVTGAGDAGDRSPVIEIIPGTGFLVAWKDGDGSGFYDEPYHIHGQMFDFDGNKVGEEFTVDASPDASQNLPDVISLANGALVFGFTNYGVSGTDYEIGARMFFPITHGTEGNDDFAGTANRDFYMGHGGDDVVHGESEDDGLSGGDGNDQLYGGDGHDNLDGGAGNDTLDGGAGPDHMAGDVGDDSYFVDDAGDVVTENSGEGTDTVTSSVSFSLADNVENLTLTGTADANGFGNELDNVITGNDGSGELDAGSGNDTIHGNGGNDVVQGWDGNDALYGEAGNDTLLGGAGDDTIDGGAGSDKATYIDAQSAVTVSLAQTAAQNTIGDGIDTLTGIENLEGSNYSDMLTGDAEANSIHGGYGNDTLNGGAGADKLYGGAGDDTYIVDNVSDIISELVAQGADTVKASVTYSLRSNVENLMLTGSAAIDGTGNGLDNEIRGNGAANTLDGGSGEDLLMGNAGDDTLTGESGNDVMNGGTGADTMAGGLNNDTYYVDSASDVVIENASEGIDTVVSAIDYTLGDHVENLTFLGTAVNATGNALDNTIRGSNVANMIDGGAGADHMYGAAGNDTYIVDNASDRVGETTNNGTDTVLAGVTFKLGANVENLTLTGANFIGGTGNGLDNVIVGNDAQNTLNGETGNDTLTGNGGSDVLNGGDGADNMAGGTGNDTYYVDNASDVVTEKTGEGTDRVKAGVDWTLGANLENLSLTGSSSINGTGNSLANNIHGNDGANTLNGGAGVDSLVGGGGDDTLIGGAGRDTLIGGAGNDTFVFRDGDLGATTATADRIADFASGADKIDLSRIDADVSLAGNQDFTFVGTNAFTHTAGELRYEQIGGNTYVSGDTNGDGIADFMIKLDGSHALTGTDLVP